MAGRTSAPSFFSFARTALNLQSAAIFLLIFVVVLKLFRRPKNLPPGPWRWPFLGNFVALTRSKKHTHEVLAEWARQYGSIMSVSLRPAGDPAIVVSDIGIAKELLSRQWEHHVERSWSPLTPKIADVRGSFVWDKGERAKEQRRFGLGAFRKMGVGKKSLEHRINEEARYLVESIEAEKNRPFDPNLPIHKAVSNIICSISFGSRFDYDDPKFKNLLDSMRVVFENEGISSWANTFSFLYHTPFLAKLRECVRFVKEYIETVVQDHQDSYDENDFRDIIDIHIADIKGKEQIGSRVATGPAPTITHQHIWRGIMDLFAAGTDTTSNTLLWLISFVLKYPEVQEKIQQEISEVVGSNRQPSCEDRPSMPYTNAVINEVQRLRPVGIMALPYETTEEFQLKGYTIPKGRKVFINLWAMMNDPKVWDRPEEFNPGRFLSEDGKTVIQHETFIPFSTGRRSCLGEGLAKTELFLFATNLFQRFTFMLPPGASKPELKGILHLTFVPEPFKVRAIKR
ncbi:cytochrome P450 2J5-like isoform X1 [Acanthaster planci]|uniref:Cytochrome P450 2J5-like isoform X1 n=1 Tax=Acanthaster planci TaxID=133434 RepID=A0A8B7Y2X3_ACAPL|nr:cytochrome P450 2J5-like isoform X1 [Acanthaster planci]XP_022087526.1 cytochrome P450 2J5-like isoform X1 [Acanthaster planci]XP_022087527.1 cytochrome P450 2J5-like isoform X1 [Acanthaster planci]